ncbi:MAG: hypothetical protein ACI8RZ_006096 [Myxococcota bacterium]|jgi:hypothetical protein
MRTLIIALLTLLPLTAAAEGFTEAELLEAVEIYAPNRYDRLTTLKDTDPDAYEAALEAVSEKLIARNLLKSEYSARLSEVEVRFKELAAKHAEASKRQQEAIRVELEEVAVEYFELKMELKRMRLEAIRAKVDRMEDELERHEARRDEVISRRIDAILEEGE